tara:strand:- start:3362 stop:5176 length:1815 start_codon:yes stop_codon:yes gene_type:complete
MDGLQGKDRPDDNSVLSDIDRLASLPQALIMQMAQKGQIPKEDVLPIMNKKNENAQAAAQIRAVAQQMAQQQQMGGPPPSTVFEKVMAQNASREAVPMDRSNVGIASAPMRPDMFAKASGGIVAFSGEDGSLVRQKRLAEAERNRLLGLAGPSNAPVFGFVDALVKQGLRTYPGTQTLLDGARTLPADPNDRPLDDAINPVGRIEDNNPLANARLLGASTEVKAEPIYDEKTGKVIYPEGYTDIKEGEYPERAAVRDYLAEGERRGMLPEEGEKPSGLQEAQAEQYFAEQRAAREIPKSGPTDEDLLGRPEGEVEGLGDVVADMADKTQSIMDSIGLQKPEDFKPEDFSVENTRKLFTDAGVNLNLLSDQAKKLGQERLKLDKDKKEALAFFGLEAGLNILAGKDPNALVNIGAGAGKAIAPLRKELTRLKDQHNALRKEENQLARMQSQQDMGIAKFSQERLNDARKSYDANLRNYNTTRAQIANRVLADNSALQRVKMQVKGQKEAAEIKAGATGLTASALRDYRQKKLQTDALEDINNTNEQVISLNVAMSREKDPKRLKELEKERDSIINRELAKRGIGTLEEPITSDRYKGFSVTEVDG